MSTPAASPTPTPSPRRSAAPRSCKHTRVTDLVQREDGTLGRGHREGHHPRRARRQRRRPVGARGRPHGRARAARPRHGAPVPHHRGHARARSTPSKEMLHVVDFEGEIYMRQERGGILLGTYERAGVPWSEKETPWNFGHELLQHDLDRIAPSLEVGFEHFPALEQRRHQEGHQRPLHLRAGRQPAGRPDPGPAQLLGRLRRDGRLQPGRRRRPRARQLDGQRRPRLRRLGAWTSPATATGRRSPTPTPRCARTTPAASASASPTRSWPPARPLRTTPIYDRLKAENAVFGESYGLEHPLWFAPKGDEPVEDITFRRSNAFPHVARGGARRCASASG